MRTEAMARIHHRKARKDYPANGIKKGDMYYTTSIKTGPRSSRTIRSLTPIPASQMTSSSFKGGWFAMQEGVDVTETFDIDDIRSCAEQVRELGEQSSESYENMPEGLQQGDTGQLLYGRVEHCETTADELERIADELDDLEEPQDPSFDPDDYAEELAEFGDDDEARDEFIEDKEAEVEDEYQIEMSEYESTYEGLIDEARDLIGDMPE